MIHPKLSPFLLSFILLPIGSLFGDRTVGDLNGDGTVDLLDTVRMVEHIQGTQFITDDEALKWQADVNEDGLVNSFDVEKSLDLVFKREQTKKLPLAGVLATSPYDGEGNVALTREFVVRFNMPLAKGTVLTNNIFYAYAGDELQVTAARLSSDRMKASLFLNGDRWPSNGRITVTFDGSSLSDFLNRGIDLDGDGVSGGKKTWSFSTLSVQASDISTVVSGQVFDSDNSNGEKPLAGVLVSVVGNEEELSVVTDSNGSFRLTKAPIGKFFVVIDGRMVGAAAGETLADGSWRNRDYYTFVGKAWEAVAGKTVQATRYGTYTKNGTYQPSPKDGKIFLPLVMKGALQTVSATQETKISFAAGYVTGLDAKQKAMLEATSISVPPGALQSDDGTTGGSVGIAPVASDRLPEPLPESLAMPLVITVQTDGPSNFDVPVPARFPNADNLPPGTKSALWSFNHDTGIWEIAGPMTVSADGLYLETDPGVGIRQPGWHGTSPGAQIFGKAVLTGPTLKDTMQGACPVSHASMGISENEFISLGQLSEGIEETVFGGNQRTRNLALNESDLNFNYHVLQAGIRFASGRNSGGKDWDLFRKHVNKEALLHAKLSQQAGTLLGGNDFWNGFTTAALTIRDKAIMASMNSQAQTRITTAHTNFTKALERSRTSIEPQLKKWENYTLALNGLLGQTQGIAQQTTLQSDRSKLLTELQATSKAYRALPGGRSRSRLDRQLKTFARQWQKFLFQTMRGNLHPYKGEAFVFIKRIGSEAEENRTPPILAQRVKVGQGGSYRVIVRPNSYYEVWMLEPTTLVIGSATFVSPRNGGNAQVPPVALCHDDKPDSDSDYLSDRSERIVGTRVDQSDTDGDAVPDGFEVLMGSDPTGGNPVFTGILATIPPKRGAFSDFVTTGNDLAILGNGRHGIEVFDIGSGVRPVKLSTFDTPGSVRKAVLADNYLVIADAQAGLTVLDLSSPESPSQVWSIRQSAKANSVAAVGKIAFVGLENGTVNSYDLFSGQLIDSISFKGIIEDLGILVENLIVLENVKRQRSRTHSIPTRNGRFSNDQGPFLPRKSVDTPGYRQWGLGNGLGRRLFVGDEFAYVTSLMGFNRIDLSDPSNPIRAERLRTASRGWRQTVANGSGLALAIEHRFSPRFAKADPSVYTIRKNGDFLRPGGAVQNFETRFITPGNAGAISIYNGLAYVADGKKGLQVVNYKSFDINGVRPTLQVSLDQNQSAEESTNLTMRAFVEDDIQVRNVEFYVDGRLASTDGGYPFSYSLQVPLRQSQDSLRLRVVARDTGGNEAYWPGPDSSAEFVLPIVDDLIPPEVLTYFPKENQVVFPNETIVTVFNERMAPDSIHLRSIRLDKIVTDAGADGLFGTGDDVSTVTPFNLASVTYDDATQSAYATLPATLPPGHYRLYATELATDLPGNKLKTPVPVRNLYGPSEIKGKFWFDRNHDTQEGAGEEALSQWTAYLDYNNNGELDLGEPSALSDSSGNYLLPNLRPGVYSVSEILPYGWTQTFPKGQNAGAAPAFTNTAFLYESDHWDPLYSQDPSTLPFSSFAVDSQGYAWETGILPEGNFSNGTHLFDGNGTGGLLSLARFSPTGTLQKVVTFGKPDPSLGWRASRPLIAADHDGGVWIAGRFTDSNLSIGGQTLSSPDTNSSYLVRFNHELNATQIKTFSGITIKALQPDAQGRVLFAGVFSGQAQIGTSALTSRGSTDGFAALLASTGTVSWAQGFGGASADSVSSLSLESNGQSLVSGSSLSSDFLAGNQALDLSGANNGFLVSLDANGTSLWANAAKSAPQSSPTDNATGTWFNDGNGSAPQLRFAQPDGNVSVSVSIGGATLGSFQTTSDGGALLTLAPTGSTVQLNGQTAWTGPTPYGLVLKLKSNGQLAWVTPISFNGYGQSSAGAIARATGSDLWVEAQISGAAAQVLTYGTHSVSLDGNDTLLLKLDATGSVISLLRASSTLRAGLLMDGTENLWLTGYQVGTPGLNRNLSVGSLGLSTQSAVGKFFGRIGQAGALSHSTQVGLGQTVSGVNFGNSLPLDESRQVIGIGGSDQDSARSVVTDPAGNAYYAGDFTGRSKIGGQFLNSDGQNDAVFVKFKPGGEIEWARNYGGDGDDLAHSLYADSNGALFACGTFQGTAKFGNFTLVSAGMRDVFVVRLNASGYPTWAFRAGGPGDDDALALVADGNGSVYLGGSIMQTADFGSYRLTAKGSKDGFLLSLDYNGNVKWVGSLLSTGQAELRDLVLDSLSRPVVAGDFTNLLELRGTGPANDGSEVLSDANGSAPAGPDLSSGLVAWYPFDGNASDMSGNGNHGTVHGGAVLDTDRHGIPGKAYSFDGVNDWIGIGSAGVGTNPVDLTQVAWIRTSNLVGIYEGPVLTKRHADGGPDWATLAISGGRAALINDESGIVELVQASTYVNDGSWHQVVGVKNNLTFKIYVDGKLENSKEVADLLEGSVQEMRIGHHGAFNQFFKGSIDEIRIYNRALSGGEIKLLYLQELGRNQVYALDGAAPAGSTASGLEAALSRNLQTNQAVQLREPGDQLALPEYNATSGSWTLSSWLKPELNATSPQAGISIAPGLDLAVRKTYRASILVSQNPAAAGSLATGLVAYYPFDGNASDMSGNNGHGSVVGATLTSDRYGKTGKAYSFDGVNDRIRINDLALNGRNAFSLSLWIKTLQGSSHFISGANTVRSNEFLLTFHSLSRLQFLTKDPGGNATIFTTTSINTSSWFGNWVHLTMTRVNSSSGMEFFVDGRFAELFGMTSGAPQIDSNGLWLGADQDSVGGGWQAGNYFNGSIDEVRIYDRALSSSEVANLYELERPGSFNGPDLSLIWCPPGTFTMGSPVTEPGRDANETQHQVTLTEGFYLGQHEVTQAQYQAVMGNNPSEFNATGNANRPVERVSWNDVQLFLERLNELERNASRLPAGWAYALPTEAQWEYACRAGTTTAYSWGATIDASKANYQASGLVQTRDVGQHAANPWGFHDMHGNIWEWTNDWRGAYPAGPATDPTGPASGSNRVTRGGSWNFDGMYLRSAQRSGGNTGDRYIGVGFRVALKRVPASSLSTGLVAYYPFDGNASDMSGNGNHGTVNGATLGTDRHGQANMAYSFDGVDDYVNMGDQSEFDGRAAQTTSLWFSTSIKGSGGLSNARPILSKWYSSGNPSRNSFFIFADANGFRYGSTSGSITSTVNANCNYSLYEWHQVSIIFDNGSISTYLNGHLVDNNNVNFSSLNNASEPLLVGNWYQGYDAAYKTFHGSIDDIRIYNRALSASEVSALYALESLVSAAPSAPAHSLTFSLEDANGSQVLSSAPVDPGELSSSGGWLRTSVGSQPVARSQSRALAGGLHQSLFIKSDGSLWGVGRNHAGQLGLGDTVDRNTTVQIVPSGVIQVSSGSAHVLFLKEDGSLWGMGKNGNGQLGLGDKTDRNATTRIVASGVTWIAAGDHHSLFLKEDGSLWSMGYNGFGQLGNGDQTDQSLPFQVKASGVIGAAAGRDHSLFVQNDGSVWGMGRNDANQLGLVNQGLSPALTYGGTLKDGVGGVDGLNWTRDIAFSPDGKHAYVAGHDDHAIAFFDRHEPSGSLSFRGTLNDNTNGIDGLSGVIRITLSSNGKHAYVSGYMDDAVSWYERNATSGVLTYGGLLKDGVGGVDGLDGPREIVLSPNEDFVYVTGVVDDAVSWFERNATSGALSYRGTLKDGVAGVDGLNYPFDIALSPNGEHAYVAGQHDHSISWFDRNSTSGALTYVGILKDGVGGVNGLQEARAIVISPDGQHVYISAKVDDSVSWFDRNANTGALTFQGLLQNGVNGVSNLNNPNEIGMSSDGKSVYVAGYSDSSVLWLDRDSNTGALSQAGQVRQGVGGVDGLNQPWGVTFSPDQKHAYITSHTDDAISWFSRSATSDANVTTPTRILTGGTAQVAAGENHSLILKDNGSLWALGGNQYGELGTGDNVDRNGTVQVVASGVVQVATGGRSDHSLFLKSDGSLWAMGRNTNGQLGDGANNDRNASVMIATGVKEIAAGYYHSLYTDLNGTLWTMGLNGHQQLGLGHSTNRNVPSQAATGLLLPQAGPSASGIVPGAEVVVTRSHGGLTAGEVVTVASVNQPNGNPQLRRNDGSLVSTSPSDLGFGRGTYWELTDPAKARYLLSLNGKAQGYATFSTNALPSFSVSGNAFNGGLDDFSLYPRFLTENELGASFAAEQVTPSVSIHHGLVAYLPLDGNASDATGNGHHGNVSGATPAKDRGGVANRAYEFDGADDFISLANPLGLAREKTTVAFWIKAKSDGSFTIFNLGGNDSNASAYGAVDVGNGHYPGLTDELVSVSRSKDGNQSIRENLGYLNQNRTELFDGAWHQVAVTFSGKTGGTSFYVDGQAKSKTVEANRTDSGKLAGTGPLAHALFGASVDGNASRSKHAHAFLDQLRVYDRALSSQEVLALYDYEKINNSNIQSAGQKDFFVARFDANGSVTGFTHGSGPGIDSANGLAAGANGVFYLTGAFGPSLTLGNLNANGQGMFSNAFLAKLDSDLNAVWLKAVGGGGFNRGESVAVSNKGTAFFTGSFTGTATFDEGSLTSAGSSDAYLAEFDARGNLLRLFTHGGAQADAGKAVATDSMGGIILAGTYQGQSGFFGGEKTLSGFGLNDVFIARYDYQMRAPAIRYDVTVVSETDPAGQPAKVFALNGKKAPDLELVQGLEYQFVLDGNTTLGHPFLFTENISTGNGYTWEVTEGVTNGRGTSGTVALRVGPKTPGLFHYVSRPLPTSTFASPDSMNVRGGLITVLRETRPSFRLTIAKFDDGSNVVDDSEIIVTKNGHPVDLNTTFPAGTLLRVTLIAGKEHRFEGWEGDLPEDFPALVNLPKETSFVVKMDRHRTIKARFSPYAPPTVTHLKNAFAITFQPQTADEFGEPLAGPTLPSYGILFGSFSPTTGEGIISTGIPQAMDANGDGQADILDGKVVFESGGARDGLFRVSNAKVDFSGDNQGLVDAWGGEFEIALEFDKPGPNLESGTYLIMRGDGSTEQGVWTAPLVRKPFSID